MADLQSTRHSHGLALALAVALTTGCETKETKRENVTVFLAASVDHVVRELAVGFEKESGIGRTLHSGASGALRKQIELDAPANLFISADSLQVDALIKAGLVKAGSQRVIANNRLVIALPKSTGVDSDLPRSLRGTRYKRIAIASPDSAPAGRYAKQALEHAGMWQELQEKLVIADDVRAAAKYAELETVDAALVYQTDATADSKLRVAYTFPADSHEPCVYVGAVIANRPGNYAQKFLDYITSSAAQPVWRVHGFDLPRPSESKP